MENPTTDIEILKRWFPKLEGIQEALWEVKKLSNDTSPVPGPGAFWAKGLIHLQKDVAKKYFEAYEWKEQTIQMECEHIDTTAFNNATWYYSKAFEESVKPYAYLGKFYFNGESIWFDVTR